MVVVVELGLLLRVGVIGGWVHSVVGGGIEGRRTTTTAAAAAAGEVGEVEVWDVEVSGVGLDGEVFVPFVLGVVVLVRDFIWREERMVLVDGGVLFLPSLCRP